MEHKKYNRFNFHKYTFCEFQEVSQDSIDELKLAYTSKSGSSYYFTENGVFRVSNHWGRAANCRWRLLSNGSKVNQRKRIGYANWDDFYPNNETERLFYIEVNWKNKSVAFQHKNNPKFNEKYYLRTAREVSKAIKVCKMLLESDTWAKYLEVDKIDVIRSEFLDKIIYLGEDLMTIKKNYTIKTNGK